MSMKIEKRPVVEVKVCYSPEVIDGIMARIDNDPSIAPRGVAQIEFYNYVINTLRRSGEMMEVTVEREVPVVPVPSGTTPSQKEIKVWSVTEETGDEHETEKSASGEEEHLVEGVKA